MTVTSVVAALQTLNASVTGIKNAPTKVPTNIEAADCPTVITWPDSASSGYTSGSHSQRTYTITVYVKKTGSGTGVFEGWNETKTYMESLLEAYLNSSNHILVEDGTYNAYLLCSLDTNPILDTGMSIFAYPPPATGVEGYPTYFGCQFSIQVKEQW